MSRRTGASVAGNPVLIGAATVLVVLVAVFLSYNANAGLPFVPTYELKAELPSGANLVRGNEVRIGGARVGAIDTITVKTLEDGRNLAVVTMKLDKGVDPLPKDSTLLVRPRSLLGQKYIQITRGTSQEGFASGDTVPLRNATPAQVEFDELIDTFDKPTRDALAINTTGFGTAFAGRGESLNQAIGALRPLLGDLAPVAKSLADPDTGLSRLVRALGRTAAQLAPVAEAQAQLFVGADQTFTALAAVAPFLQESIAESPATLDQAISSFRHLRPFLENSTGLFRELRPGARALVGAAPPLAEAFRIGTPTLERIIPFNRRLESLLVALQDFAEDPIVPRGVQDLTDAVDALRPTLDFVAPAQTRCKYATLFVRNIGDLLSVGDASGNWQRFNIIATPNGPNSETGPAAAPADGPTVENHLHQNEYPNTAAPGQPKECEAGNEVYIKGSTVIGNVPGTQQGSTEADR